MKYPFYADQQCKVWIRARFFVTAESQDEANQIAIDIITDPSRFHGGKEEYLHITIEKLQPELPFPRPTLEIYTHKDELIYDNLLDSIDITDIQKS